MAKDASNKSNNSKLTKAPQNVNDFEQNLIISFSMF